MYKQLFSIILVEFSFLIGGCTSGVAVASPVQIENDIYKSSVSAGTFLPRTPGTEQGSELVKEADKFCKSMLREFSLDKIEIKRTYDEKISQIDLYFKCVEPDRSEHRSDKKNAERYFEHSQGEYLPDTSMLKGN